MSTQKFINFNNTVACLTWVNCLLWDENALKCHQGSYQLCAFSVCSWSFHVQTGRKQKASFVTTTKYTTDQMGRWSNKLCALCSKTPPVSHILEPQKRAPSKNRKETDFQVSIDQRKCLALIVLGLPIDNHKLLARSSTVILQTRWDLNNNRKNKVRKYHPKNCPKICPKK